MYLYSKLAECPPIRGDPGGKTSLGKLGSITSAAQQGESQQHYSVHKRPRYVTYKVLAIKSMLN